MGNCQDQINNVDEMEYFSGIERNQVLIDKTHKKIFPTKYQKNIGYLLNRQNQIDLDNQKIHKSIAVNIQKNIISRKSLPLQQQSKVMPLQLSKIQPLNLTFYHSLGLQQYFYRPKVQINKISRDQLFVGETQDRMGVIYMGQRGLNGKFHGNGILKANTVQYIGQFLQGTKHGHGREIYTHEVYEGQFEFDVRKGNGKLYTASYFDEGQFNKVIIRGTRTFHNGDEYFGLFESNIMHGKERDDKNYPKKAWYYKDDNKGLLYEGNLQFQFGQLKKADRVYQTKTDKIDPSLNQYRQTQKKMLGRFENSKIISGENQEQKTNNLSNKQIINQQKIKHISQQQIKRTIDLWQ